MQQADLAEELQGEHDFVRLVWACKLEDTGGITWSDNCAACSLARTVLRKATQRTAKGCLTAVHSLRARPILHSYTQAVLGWNLKKICDEILLIFI